jgi:phage terminase large subunit-like protein
MAELGRSSKQANPVSKTPEYRRALKRRLLTDPQRQLQARVSRLFRYALAGVGALKRSKTFEMLRYCRVPDGKLVGQPIKLEPFQKKFITDVYDNPHGTRLGILSIARKNGKSALIAALVLAHLVGPVARQNAQLVSGAQSRDQAALVFNLAWKMVQLSPELEQDRPRGAIGQEASGPPMNTEFRALAAEGKTAHGLKPGSRHSRRARPGSRPNGPVR